MSIRYGKFELPKKIQIESSDEAGTFARFVAEPFERGFGHTVGNALRRIMLSSLEAPAIISVRIEGVSHEYVAIEGIIEDVTHIILNLKGTLFRQLEEQGDSRKVEQISHTLDITSDMLEERGGQCAVRLRDIIGECDFEVVNPEHVIFHVTKPMTKRIDLKIALGRGYIPSEQHRIETMVDEIVIDARHSPVYQVNYIVENTRVVQDTDYDRLIFEVRTDGRVSPQEALTFAVQIGIFHLEVFKSLDFQQISFDVEKLDTNVDREILMSKLSLGIEEIELSVRSMNCLLQAEIGTIGELVVTPEAKMLEVRNFGKKSLGEIKVKLDEMGLSLEMDLSNYGISQSNIKEVIDAYREEKAGIEES